MKKEINEKIISTIENSRPMLSILFSSELFSTNNTLEEFIGFSKKFYIPSIALRFKESQDIYVSYIFGEENFLLLNRNDINGYAPVSIEEALDVLSDDEKELLIFNMGMFS